MIVTGAQVVGLLAGGAVLLLVVAEALFPEAF
jgi:hypothetical protein